MADNKKSFLLYCDIIHTVNKLSNENAGLLFKHILSYVNDENPIAINDIVDLTFEPIKQSLKRDLIKYEQIREKKRLAGLASAESKKQNKHMSTHVDTCQHRPTKSTVIVSDSVSVIDNDIKKNKRAKKFSPPTLNDVIVYFSENGYTEISATKAFNYYNVADWIDSKGNKIKNWKQKMQGVWFKEENKEQLTTKKELNLDFSKGIDFSNLNRPQRQ